ncbi:MAG: methionyl-tRNA formyltransferase, partial [Ruminococcus sp.]
QSVLNGDKVTGITTMLMDVGLDTGDILLTEETEIGENETSGELFDRLAVLGGELILKTLSALEKGEITPVKQDESLATQTSKIDKSLCPIDFSKSASEVHNKVRGLNPWPVATTKICGKNVKVYSTRLCQKSGKIGEVLSTKPLVVACGEKSVEILEIQPEGKKRMTADAFLAGHKLEIGDIIGQEV